jgi:hypothetical protein
MSVFTQIINGLAEGTVGFAVDEGKKVINERLQYDEILKNKIESKPESVADIRLRLSKQRHNDLVSEEVEYCILNNEPINSRVDSNHLFFFVGSTYILTCSTTTSSESRGDKIRNFLILSVATVLLISLIVLVVFALFKAIDFFIPLF